MACVVGVGGCSMPPVVRWGEGKMDYVVAGGSFSYLRMNMRWFQSLPGRG